MNDKYNGELHRTMMQYGFCAKFRDRAMIEQKIKDAQGGFRTVKKLDRSGYPTGIADNVFVGPLGTNGAFIEVKTGEGKRQERFAFSRWTEDQRAFAGICMWSNIPYFLFLSMGDRVGGVEYPRRSWMMPGLVMYNIELDARTVNKKSLSYKTAVERLSAYELTWDKKRWMLPSSHPVREILRLP